MHRASQLCLYEYEAITVSRNIAVNNISIFVFVRFILAVDGCTL